MIDRLAERFQELVPGKRLQSILLHFLFWLVWLSRSFYDVIDAWGMKWSLVYIGIVFISQAPMVYFHLYYLVPKLLNRKKYFFHIAATALLVYLYSWINYNLMKTLPEQSMPESMSRLIRRIGPGYDLLEGLIAVILTYALKYTLIAFITKNELLKLQKEKLQLELNALKAQIHPHFLFNTLNNIYSLTLKNSEKASEVVLKLSDIMRYVLYQSNQEKVKLEKEIDFTKNYVALQKIRYHDRYDIRLEVEGGVGGQEIAPLLFIDFVENAFKHGIEKRFTDGYVHVKFLIDGDHLEFVCSNSKGNASEDEDSRLPHAGIGLKNVRKRLQILYPGHQLLINDESGTFTVILKIELT